MKFITSICSFIAITSAPLAAMAQPSASAKPDVVCVAKRSTGKRTGDNMVVIPVSAAATSGINKRGYRPAKCEGREVTIGKLNRNFCSLAAMADAKINQDYLTTYGVTPSELCQMTTLPPIAN